MTAVVAKRGDETKFDGFSAAEGPDDATLALIEQLAEDDRVAAAKVRHLACITTFGAVSEFALSALWRSCNAYVPVQRKREREAADDSSFACESAHHWDWLFEFNSVVGERIRF